MSQVIITRDKFEDKRRASANQEHHIDTEGRFSRWRRNDITKGYDPLAKIIGLALAPLGVVWAILGGLGTAAIWISGVFCRFMAEAVKPLLRRN